MKRITSLIIALILVLSISAVCFADNSAQTADAAQIDLSAMTYEELVALKDKINLAMWESKDWEEVTVPQGVWTVGEDIPAENWTVSAADGAYSRITVCNKLNKLKTGADGASKSISKALVSSSRDMFDESSFVERVNFDLTEWEYVIIERGSVVFTPYEGKPAMSFK